MKKLTKLLTAAAAVCTLALCLAFAGCGDDRGNTPSGSVKNFEICYVFTASEDVMTITENSSMLDYMNALQDDGKLTFTGSSYGTDFYVSTVFGIAGIDESYTEHSYSGWNWAVYTTVTSIDDVIYSNETTFDYNGITLYQSSYYVSGLPCIAGQTYALVYEYATMTF